MGSEYATDPTSPLSPTTPGGSAIATMGAMLSPRSLSANITGRSRSGSRVREGSLGWEQQQKKGRGRRKTGGKGLVRVAVDGVRGWVAEVGEMVGGKKF